MKFTIATFFRINTLCLIAALLILMGRSDQVEAAQDEYLIRYEIDRSGLPETSFPEVSINFAVGQASEIVVNDAEGSPIPYVFDENIGVVTVTTAGSEIELSFTTETLGNPLVGSYAPATLKNNYKWAWSHGIDDNVNLDGSIKQFESRGWVGTLYLIGLYVDNPSRVRDLIQPAQVQALIDEGWSIGNHTYRNIDCDLDEAAYEEDIERAEASLSNLISQSSRPDYEVTGFAAPCFLDAYQTTIQDLQRTSTSSLRFNESGNRSPIMLNRESTETTVDGVIVHAYDPNLPIGRDGTVDEGVLADAIASVDWIAQNSNESRHLWYNSVSHGEEADNLGVEVRLAGLLEHVYRTYGPLGTDEVWVAPADQVVSYVNLRDGIEISVVEVVRNSAELDLDAIKAVEPGTIGSLESTGFLPTRERPADTPIPIIIEPKVAEETPEPIAEVAELEIVEDPVSEQAFQAESESPRTVPAPEETTLTRVIRTLTVICISVIGLLILVGLIYLAFTDRLNLGRRR